MELDLLGESESDSDESTHSHADNASIQRSAVTAATAGSDAGLLHSLPNYSHTHGDHLSGKTWCPIFRKIDNLRTFVQYTLILRQIYHITTIVRALLTL